MNTLCFLRIFFNMNLSATNIHLVQLNFLVKNKFFASSLSERYMTMIGLRDQHLSVTHRHLKFEFSYLFHMKIH